MVAKNRGGQDWRAGRGLRVGLGLLVVFCVAVLAKASTNPIERLILPLEYYEDGTVKARMTAATASIPEEGEMTASVVRVELFTPAGVVESSCQTESCWYDRVSGVVTSSSPVRLQQPGVLITGTGFRWNLKDRVFRIQHDVRVELAQGAMAR